DNGIGIPQSDIPLVCKKSFTGENGRKHAKSTGMGLYIIDNLCRQLGHKLNITSKVDEYTDVSIVFGHNDIYKIG
ncbi:MAG TPA: sensor histidine kinase, partial [Coprococcus sp.]|nr:sensor histidine kinase [Coprococcus sp.]